MSLIDCDSQIPIPKVVYAYKNPSSKLWTLKKFYLKYQDTVITVVTNNENLPNQPNIVHIKHNMVKIGIFAFW